MLDPSGSFVRRHWRALAATAAIAAVATSTTALLGGFETAEQSGTARPGELVEAEPFRLTIDDAVTGRRVSGVKAPTRRTTLVAVRGTLEVTSPEPVGSGTIDDLLVVEGLGSTFDVFGDPADEPVASLRVPDGSALFGMGPGLGYDVAWLYVVAEDDVPTELDVTVQRHELTVSQLDGEERWLLPESTVRLSLPVTLAEDEAGA